MSPMLLFIMTLLVKIANSCTYQNNGPIQIGINTDIGSMTVRNIMEISFEFQIDQPLSCPGNIFCHIFAIGTRFPLIFTNSAKQLAVAIRSAPDNLNVMHIVNNAYPIITDGNWHHLYLKWSFTETLVLIDNVEYININDGSFAYNNYINQVLPIWTVWANPPGNQEIHNGTIRNICISSQYTSLNPTVSPTFNPTNIPSISPTKYPTLYPTKYPTVFPTKIPTVFPTKIPTVFPTKYPTVIPTTSSPTETTINPSVAPTATPNMDNQQIIETTQNVMVTDQSDTVNNTDSNDIFWPILIVTIILLCICIICVIIIIIKRVWNKNDEEKKDVDTSIKLNIIHHTALNISHIQPNNMDDTLNRADNDMIINDDDDESPGNYDDDDDDEEDYDDTPGENDDILINDDDKVTPNRLYTEKEFEIENWLKSMRMPQYFDNFKLNGYESLEIIKNITERNKLNEIGITLKGHQTKIMAEIARLRNKNDGNEDNDDNNDDDMDDVDDNEQYEGDDMIIRGDNDVTTHGNKHNKIDSMVLLDDIVTIQ